MYLNVSIKIANKLGNLKKKKSQQHDSAFVCLPLLSNSFTTTVHDPGVRNRYAELCSRRGDYLQAGNGIGTINNLVVGPETKSNRAGEDQEQFTGDQR
jgi:hypothetical protein